MADVAIHRLGANDTDTIRAMLAMFGDAFEDVKAYRSAQPDDAYLARLLASETFIALAAIVDGAVVGGIAGYVLHKFEQARREVYLYDLAVAEAHRRRGIASALIGELRSVAVTIGAYVIFVQADLGDDPAIALYESLGDREDVLHFDIAVP
ncbi:AAC(3)-I family aminoglycoside N-acetyltransferase [Sphingomonas bacterium]|uniref:AAC(3)-I family aminoglycoside N-acetyltransferase n=1 Tax=Sphingomonas bacterium TaxID=1895847 RepID=UPI00261CAA46|nr:AAC(3)-I family aminoglycoside N-acetyltransferase [Sphingomonas bacterium]MDB5678970.1 Gentamicin 3-N-acetyltransferase [Sphingomonas bacterium]